MELAFETKGLRRLCEHENVAIRKFGGVRASKLKDRISDLEAAVSLQDLVFLGLNKKDSGSEISYELSVDDQISICFMANHAGADLQLHEIGRIKLTAIEIQNG
ncbi:hypothetical protein RHODOSMS8_02016 [Rhodobiaceae bacterium]|nr:hypothetical protein RHODOSMS8_02016 [Rhodobiaceae bacterium]